MNNIVEFLLARLGEKSTWIGILSMLTAIGVTVAPGLGEAVAAAGLAIVGVIAALMKEDGAQ